MRKKNAPLFTSTSTFIIRSTSTFITLVKSVQTSHQPTRAQSEKTKWRLEIILRSIFIEKWLCVAGTKSPHHFSSNNEKKKHLFLGNIHLLRANSIPPWKIIENMRYLLLECDVLHNFYGRLFAKRFCNNFGKMTFSMSNEAKIVCLNSLVNISDIFLFEVTSRRHSLKSRKTPKIDSVLNQL